MIIPFISPNTPKHARSGGSGFNFASSYRRDEVPGIVPETLVITVIFETLAREASSGNQAAKRLARADRQRVKAENMEQLKSRGDSPAGNGVARIPKSRDELCRRSRIVSSVSSTEDLGRESEEWSARKPLEIKSTGTYVERTSERERERTQSRYSTSGAARGTRARARESCRLLSARGTARRSKLKSFVGLVDRPTVTERRARGPFCKGV